MKLQSNYNSMVQSAAMCPDDTNLKLIIRHSIRPEIKTIDQNVSLTEDGEILAYQLGMSLDIPLGSLVCSPSIRCKQTCEEIVRGYSEQNQLSIACFNIRESALLMDSHVIDGNKSQQNFIDLGNHGLLKKYACGDKLDGQYGLSDSVEPILNFIFEIGNSSSTIDVFCTHDFQIMLFLLYIYGCEQSNQDQIWNSWPQMLEGLFLWGDKNHFWACWRGEIKEVIMKDF